MLSLWKSCIEKQNILKKQDLRLGEITTREISWLEGEQECRNTAKDEDA